MRSGGGTREQCGSNKSALSLKNLTTRGWGMGVVGRWPMEGGQGGRWGGNGGGVGRRARGEMGGGHQRAVWEQQKVHWFPFLAPLKT